MKIKLLQIHDYPPLEGGGIEVNVSRVSKYLIEMGYDVTLATGRSSSETYTGKNTLKSFVTDYGLKVEILDNTQSIESLIKKADLVNIHFTFSCRPTSMIAMDYCCRFNKKCIVTVRTAKDHIPFSALSSVTRLEREYMISKVSDFLSRENVFISAPSYSIRDSLEFLGVNKELKIVRNGITIYERDAATDDLSLGEISVVDLTYLGEISFMKGVNYLVDAIKIVKEKYSKLKVRFIGGGSDFSTINQLIKVFNLEDTIELLGYVNNSEISNYLLKTRLYVQASLTEVWGNSIAEALALGVPVIATKVGGIPEMTLNDKFATLVKSADASSLAKEILRNLTDLGVYNFSLSKAVNAKEFFRQNYTLMNQAKELNNFYQYVYEQK